mmetsp:Transcript_22282/g.44468  ORF Transcript_22282/g.44468 Transcript_22282/m.44468 type:complete len:97 (-) Transcript_22282:93-383(-)
MGFSVLLATQNRAVGLKLLRYTLLMFTLPLLTYYLVTAYYGYKAGTGASVVVVNAVIAAYVKSAFDEDDEDDEDERRARDESAPRVGVWKGRGKTD